MPNSTKPRRGAYLGHQGLTRLAAILAAMGDISFTICHAEWTTIRHLHSTPR